MTSNFDEREQIRFLSTAARLANRERVPRVDEVWMRGMLDRLAPAQIPESGFPAAPVGDARDRNNLRRTNWFNGRYLTAEALSRQDVYFDHRSRLNAHALMPGIAWGLGIEGNGLNQLQGEQLKNGFSKNGLLTLRRGLAFDGVGRPIVVSQDFRFTLEDLIGVSLKTPRRVVGDGREFTPCVCLSPDPGGPSGGCAALPSGPYLLVIEAGEVPEGKARVTGDVCGGRRTAPCEADLWQGSFGLSLVRFPVDVPLLNDLPDVWALRGTLSAYYFDVFEHPLWKRWDPTFPIDGSFGRDSGPGRHEGMAIPLALVHLGEDGTALYLDSWIPRRLITATPGEDWHRTRFGAPPRAAAWARIHQFQTMLQESLAVRPMARTAPAGANLHSRGFRHIPPIGFLPVVPQGVRNEGDNVTQLTTVCTDFAKEYEKNGRDVADALNPFQGDQARFNVSNRSSCGNLITARRYGAIKGLFIDNNDRCSVSLLNDAETVTLLIQFVDTPAESIVLAYDFNSIEVAKSEILGNGNGTYQKVTLHTSTTLIHRVEIEPKRQVILSKFCYSYRKPVPQLPPVSRAGLVDEAVRQGKAYFKDTNVVLYGVAALHDDDILEDLSNVIDKDPLQLERRPSSLPSETRSEDIKTIMLRLATSSGQKVGPALLLLAALGYSLRENGLDIDALVNRRTEVVKLVVPLQGLSRLHPLLGAIPKDAVPQAAAWGLAGPSDLGAATLVGVLRNRGFDLIPRSFVVYVKQRLVLLDVLLRVLEVLEVMVTVVTAGTDKPTNVDFNRRLSGRRFLSERLVRPVSTRELTLAYLALPVGDQILLRSTLDQPVVQELLLQTIEGATPALARGNRAAIFQAQVQEVAIAQPAGAGDAVERQRLALAQVADAWAAEYPDVQVIQLLAAVQPPEQTLDLVRQLGARPGPSAGPTVADGLDLVPPKQFETETSRTLYTDVRSRLEEQPLSKLVPDLPTDGVAASLTVGELLARSPQEAEQLLGGAPKLEEVRTAFLRNREDALNAAEGLADGVPSELLVRAEAEVGRGVAADEALAKLKEEEAAKPQPDALLLERIDRSATLLRLGGNRLDVLGGLRRPPGV